MKLGPIQHGRGCTHRNLKWCINKLLGTWCLGLNGCNCMERVRFN